MSQVLHPKCGKRFPGGSTAGHCGACCETFIGLAAFEAHRIGSHMENTRRCLIQPYVSYGKEYPHYIQYGHWQDERGYWHYGKQLTDEEKAKLWPKKEEA